MSIAAGIVLTSEGEAAGEASEAVSYQPSAFSIQHSAGLRIMAAFLNRHQRITALL